MEVSDENIEINTVQIQDIVRCMTAISVRPLAITGSWMQFDHKTASALSPIGYSYSENLFDNTLSVASFNPVQLDGEAVAQLFGRFQEYKSSDKNVLRITLDRLNQSLRRRNDVDKVIDLGMALEVILLHDSSKNERGNKNYPGELRFRSSIRGAMFLGGANLERKNTLQLLKEAYDLRSEAVHSGGLKRRRKGPAPEQTLSEAMGTCARIARKLIERGSFPDWDAEYVIGGE